MKRINITESQFKLLMRESLGISNDVIEASKAIIQDIIDNYLTLEDEYEEEYYDSFTEYMQDACNDIGITDVWVNDDTYYYGFFYQLSNIKGQYNYDDNAVMINYKGIQDIIDQAHQYYNSTDEEQIHNYIATSLSEYLSPILTHELTHSKDEYGEAQGKWIGVCYKGNEEDLRDILYTFSENEMDARVGSVGGLVTSFINDTNFGINFERDEFDDLVDQIMNDNDLQVEYMALLIDMLERELETVLKTEDRNNFKKYSLCYDLFRNDTRLKNNRNLKRMFDNNSISAYKFVIRFYTKLFTKYKQRILRAIWYVWDNLPQTEEINENILNEQTSSTVWHFTNIDSLYYILSSNKFKFTRCYPQHALSNPGITGYSEKHPYYMCTTRSKSPKEGYSLLMSVDNQLGFARIELNGDKLNNITHGKASDYFGTRDEENYYSGKRELYQNIKNGYYNTVNDIYADTDGSIKDIEKEDTVWFNKEYFPNASKYINKIDIFICKDGKLDSSNPYIDGIIRMCKKMNIHYNIIKY